jgi:hypothetical protein
MTWLSVVEHLLFIIFIFNVLYILFLIARG